MPKGYLEIKRGLKRQGMSEDEAEKHAARIYNAKRSPGTPPVTGHHKKRRKRSGK